MSITSLLYKKIFNAKNDILYSIVTPIYNQETTIIKTLSSIINNTQNNFEIILILDFCFDNTEKYIMEFLENYEAYLDKAKGWRKAKSKTAPTIEVTSQEDTSQEEIANGLDMEGTK